MMDDDFCISRETEIWSPPNLGLFGLCIRNAIGNARFLIVSLFVDNLDIRMSQ